MIEVLTLLTKQTMSKYSRYNLFRNKFLLIAAPLLLLALSIAFIILNPENLVLPIVGAGLSLAVPLVVITANELSTNALYKTAYNQEEPAYINYLFNQNNFELKNNFGGLVTTNVLNYDRIILCVELKNFFYLYLNKSYAYIVDKTNFKQGTVNELAELLSFHCLKYKKKF